MNKKFLLILALTLIFVMFITACGKGRKKDITNSETQSELTSDSVSDDLDWITESEIDSSDVISSNSDKKTESDSGKQTENSSDSVTNNQNNTSSQVSSSVSNSSVATSSVSSNNTDSKSESSEGIEEFKLLTYEEYENLTPAEQQKYCESFETMLDFGKWYEEAKKEYDANRDAIEVSGNGTLDLDKYLE